MKAIFVGGTCQFCETVKIRYPNNWEDTEGLIKGRAYTIVKMERFVLPPPDPIVGYGVQTLEGPMLLGMPMYHCSCMFREIDGDKDSWEGIVRKSRPKTPELA